MTYGVDMVRGVQYVPQHYPHMERRRLAAGVE